MSGGHTIGRGGVQPEGLGRQIEDVGKPSQHGDVAQRTTPAFET
ncbi:hypothetical protein [Amycolatopsis sp. NPDC059021]